jgi:hypothetical protein
VNTKLSLDKKVDLPPLGPRNADPLTDASGAHPVEAGIGAAIGGVVTGMAIGAVAGPVTAAVGAAIGAVAGGYIGKDVGELIDPTVDGNHPPEGFESNSDVESGERLEECQPAHCNGGEIVESGPGQVDFETMDEALEQDWSAEDECVAWNDIRAAVKQGYERSRKIRNKSAEIDPDSSPR